MSLDPSTFETIVPSRRITFSLPGHLHLAVLDSPSAAAPPSAAAMLVPPGRETDWIFTTFSGHLHLLLLSPRPLSRLILITPSSNHQNLDHLLSALAPRSPLCEITEVPFLVYEDEVVKGSVLQICQGPFVGEMLVEDVELLGKDGGVREFRRRLRFKRMPNFVQSQMRIRPKNGLILEDLGSVGFELDKGVLVQPYLSPMVAGVSLISGVLEGWIRDGGRPRALCLGVGGGALLGFLSVQLGFEVTGVEEDEVVLKVAERYFGLERDESICLVAGDGIEYVKSLARSVRREERFHVVMVDLDSSDVALGVCAPPVEFVKKSVLRAARGVLSKEGILVVNTIPSNKLFYERLVCEFQEVFEELYEIDVGNGENFVLIATKSKCGNDMDSNGGTFLNKLKSVVPRSYFDLIRKISKKPGSIV